MTRPAAFDARILDKLAQVAAQVRNNGWGTAADVARMAQHLTARTPNPRAEAAERENRALRAQLDAVTHATDSRVQQLEHRIEELTQGRTVELPAGQAEVLAGAVAGKQQWEIAAELGCARSNVSGLLQRAAHGVGAEDLPTALVLIRSGAVTVKARKTRRSRAA